MADVFLSRSDLRMVDMGIRVLQEEAGASGALQRRVDVDGVDVSLSPIDSSVRVQLGEEVAKWLEYAEAGVAVGAAAWKVYKAYKSGAEVIDPVVLRALEFNPRASLDELIAARHEMERALFDAGG